MAYSRSSNTATVQIRTLVYEPSISRLTPKISLPGVQQGFDDPLPRRCRPWAKEPELFDENGRVNKKVMLQLTIML